MNWTEWGGGVWQSWPITRYHTGIRLDSLRHNLEDTELGHKMNRLCSMNYISILTLNSFMLDKVYLAKETDTLYV